MHEIRKAKQFGSDLTVIIVNVNYNHRVYIVTPNV